MQIELGLPKLMALASVFLSLLVQGASAAAPQVASRPRSSRVEGMGQTASLDGMAVYASAFFLLLGVVLVVLDAVMLSKKRSKASRSEPARSAPSWPEDVERPAAVWKDATKAIRADVTASNFGRALERWREATALAVPCPIDVLRLLLQGAEDLGPVREVLAYAQRFPTYDRTTVLNLLLKATADLKGPARASMQEAYAEFQAVLEAPPNQATFEALLLGTCEAAGVEDLDAAVRGVREHGPLKPHLCVAVVHAFLRSAGLERCVDFLETEQFVMPKNETREFLGKASSERSAAEALALSKRLSDLRGSRVETEEFLSAVVQRHARALNPDACREAMDLARTLGFGLHYTALEWLVRAYASYSREEALVLFDEFVAAYPKVKEGTCVSIIGSCAQSRYVALAEKVYAFRRRVAAGSGPRCSITVYASMMRVYSQAQRYGDACDVYHHAEQDGVQADARMRACYEDFAARKAGRGRPPAEAGWFKSGPSPAPASSLTSAVPVQPRGAPTPPWRKAAAQ